MHAPFDFNFEFDADEELLLLEALSRRAHCGGSLNTVGFVRNIEVNTTPVGNAGAGLDPLHSFTLDAGLLRSNGDQLRPIYSGSFAANANTKRLRVSIGGQVIFDTTLLNFINGRGWRFVLEYTRLTDTTIRATGDLITDQVLATGAPAITVLGGGLWLSTSIRQDVTVADLDTNSTILLVEGESGAGTTDDVIQNFSSIDIVQN